MSAGQPSLPRRDATVDPAVCPRCKGDNQDAFELCATCAAAGQPDTQQQTKPGTAESLARYELLHLIGDDSDETNALLDAYRAGVLREAADEAERDSAGCNTVVPCQPCATRRKVANRLRRMADEAAR